MKKEDPVTGERTCERCGRWYTPDDRYWALRYCPECEEELSMKGEPDYDC